MPTRTCKQAAEARNRVLEAQNRDYLEAFCRIVGRLAPSARGDAKSWHNDRSSADRMVEAPSDLDQT